MKYLIAVGLSIILTISQNASADTSDFLGGMAGGMIGGMIGSGIRQRDSQQQNSNQQSQKSYSQTTNRKRTTRKRSKSTKKRVSQDLSPIAIAFRSLTKDKQYLLQSQLQGMGLYTSRVDGMWGGGTRSAIMGYAKNNGQEYLLATPNGANILLNGIIEEKKLQVTPDTQNGKGKQKNKETNPKSETTIVNPQEIYKKELDGLKSQYNDIQKQIELLKEIVKDQKSRPENNSRKPKIDAILDQIEIYSGEQKEIVRTAQRKYKTPIHPQNTNLGITAVKASETFPKIPYYIAGTNEIGDMWVEPKVSDVGKLYYKFVFMDPISDYAKVRESIRLESTDIEMMVKGFEKVNDWTNTAQKKGIRKRFSKRAICFPASNCTEKKVGNTSTEVIFLIYEDGSTAAKVQRNKGNFSSGYNFSVESSMLLAAYLEFVKGVGQKEFETGSMTEKQLNTIFQ